MTRSLSMCWLLPVLFALGCGGGGGEGGSSSNLDGETDEQRRGRIATNIAGVDPTMGDAGRAPVGGQPAGGGESDENPSEPEPAEPEEPTDEPDPATAEGPPWVVLSNFRKQSQGIQTLGETYRVDYRWVSGRPSESVGRHFVVEMAADNGLTEKQAAEPVQLDPSGGTATIALERAFGFGTPVCFLGTEQDGGYVPISGRLKLGDSTETAETPDTNPTVVAEKSVDPPPPTLPPVVPPTPAVEPVVPAVPVPIAAPADLPEAPAGQKGTASYVLQDFVIKVAKADYDGLPDLVSDDADGELGRLREGKLPVERANTVRKALFKVQVADIRSLTNGSRQFVLRSATGQLVRVELRKRRGNFVVVAFELSELANQPAVPDF